MGKKKSRTKYVSKGERSPIDRKLVKAARKEWVGSTAQITAKYNAWLRGKNVVLTIPNPNTNETNKRFIRVNANDVWRRKTA